MSVTPLQNVAIIEEVRTSIELIKAGLGHLQRIDGANDFYHLPILNLASGFERLMKTIICFHILRETGDFPIKSPWPRSRKGHDLVFLLDKITSECFSNDYLKLACAQTDIKYLCDDALLKDANKILSEFGMNNRYYYLNIVLDKTINASSMEQQWRQLEFDILSIKKDWQRKLKLSNINENFRYIYNEIIVMFEKCARALTRLFTLGGLGDEAKSCTGYITPFLFLRDDQLGKQTY